MLASLFEELPSATLGAVVIDAMVGLITFAQLKRYYRVNRADWLFFMGAGLGIPFVGIIQGILIGVIASAISSVMPRSYRRFVLRSRRAWSVGGRTSIDREPAMARAGDRRSGLKRLEGCRPSRSHPRARLG